MITLNFAYNKDRLLEVSSAICYRFQGHTHIYVYEKSYEIILDADYSNKKI